MAVPVLIGHIQRWSVGYGIFEGTTTIKRVGFHRGWFSFFSQI